MHSEELDSLSNKLTELNEKRSQIEKQIRQLELETVTELINKYNFTIGELYSLPPGESSVAPGVVADWTNINSYGATKVCDISPKSTCDHWEMLNENSRVLYSAYNSHVYIIVVDTQVVKIGESGQPLGIKSKATLQPITGTKSRLGRLCNQPGPRDTDFYIRNELSVEVKQGKVSVWAIPILSNIGYINTPYGQLPINLTGHKDAEKVLLEQYKKQVGKLPRLNKATK